MTEQPELFSDTPAAAVGLEAAALAIFWYWAEERYLALGVNGRKPKQVATAKRLAKIRARLREGYTPDDLRRAIDGVLASDFHIQNGYTDIELICRDQAHVDRYALLAPKKPKRNPADKFYR